MTKLRTIVAGLALIILTSACTPAELLFFIESTRATADAVSNDTLRALRQCESTNNYSAVSPSGSYRGAYQFGTRTWDDLAERHFPWLEGRDPATVEPWWQDAMARALWSERGSQPWPVCRYRL